MRKINKQFVVYEVNENDTATRREEIAEGHRKYIAHIANERRRLGLDVCVCNDSANF